MKYEKVITLKITNNQYQTLNKLRVKKIRISNFIREAIKEKIQRDYASLVHKPKISDCPF